MNLSSVPLRYSKNGMFTWICPHCGREVPPSYNDCPDCAAKAKAQPPAVQPEAAPPRAASPDLPFPRAARAPATVVAPTLPPLQPTPARTTLPTWLMAIVSALAFVGIGAAAFFTLQYFQKQPAAPARPLPRPRLPDGPPDGVHAQRKQTLPHTAHDRDARGPETLQGYSRRKATIGSTLAARRAGT